jgi:hypothetical protein
MGRTVMLPTVLLNAQDKALPIHCPDCGETLKLVSPVSITTLVFITRAFDDCHAECVLDRKEREGR